MNAALEKFQSEIGLAELPHEVILERARACVKRARLDTSVMFAPILAQAGYTLDPSMLRDELDAEGLVVLDVRGPDGKLKDRRIVHNMICVNGKNKLLLASAAEYINQFAYLAVGTGSTAPTPANTTLGAQTAISSVITPTNPTVSTVNVSGATNATPIVITTASAHGLVDGQMVTVASVGGNTAANGTFFAKVTGYSTTTFGLYSDPTLLSQVAGNGAYTSGGTAKCAVNYIQFQNTFAAGVATGAITEAGLFDAASSGNLLSRLTFSAINVGAADTLQITYQLA